MYSGKINGMQCLSQLLRGGGWGGGAGTEWRYAGQGWSQLARLAHDLPGSSISSPSRLWGSLVGAHLQADNALSLLHLVLREVSAVLLSFPVEVSQNSTVTFWWIGLKGTCNRLWLKHQMFITAYNWGSYQLSLPQISHLPVQIAGPLRYQYHWSLFYETWRRLVAFCMVWWLHPQRFTYLKNQSGLPWNKPSSLVTATLPTAISVLCTEARSFAVTICETMTKCSHQGHLISIPFIQKKNKCEFYPIAVFQWDCQLKLYIFKINVKRFVQFSFSCLPKDPQSGRCQFLKHRSALQHSGTVRSAPSVWRPCLSAGSS